MPLHIIFITYILENICCFLIACKSLELKIKNVPRISFYVLLPAGVLSVLEWKCTNVAVFYVLSILIEVAVFWACFRQTLAQIFSLYVYVYVVNGLLQYVSVLPIIIFPNVTSIANYSIIALTGLVAICYILYRFIPLHHLYQILMASDLVSRMVVINLYLVVTTGVIYYKMNHASFGEIFILFFIFLSCFVAINSHVVYTRVVIARQKQILHAYEQYQPIVDNLIQDIRMRQHNYDNVLQSFAALPLICQDYDSITAALNKYSTEAFHGNIEMDLLKLNERLVAGLLYTKVQEAKKQGKILDITIKNYVLQTTLPEYLLMECIGILVDNAIEAVPQDSVIHLELHAEHGQVVVITKNVGAYLSDELLKKMFEVGYTTKNDTEKKHGLGLPFLQRIIKKYNGIISCYNDPDTNEIVFKVTV